MPPAPPAAEPNAAGGATPPPPGGLRPKAATSAPPPPPSPPADRRATPPPPRRPGRLALVMGGLLLTALAGTAAFTGVPWSPAGPPAPDPVRLTASLAFRPPPGWTLTRVRVDPRRPPDRWELVDAAQPGRRLRLFRFDVDPAASARDVLPLALPGLIAGRRPISPLKTPDGGPPAPGVFELFFSTRRLNRFATGAGDGSPQTHAAAAVRLPDREALIVQLSALTTDADWSPDAEVRLLQDLRAMLKRLEPAAGAAATGGARAADPRPA